VVYEVPAAMGMPERPRRGTWVRYDEKVD